MSWMTRWTLFKADLPLAHTHRDTLVAGKVAGGLREIPSFFSHPESLKQTLERVRCPHRGSPPLEVSIRKPGPEVLMLGIVWCAHCCQDSDFKTLHHQLQPVSDWEIYQWVSLHCTAKKIVYIAELKALWCPWWKKTQGLGVGLGG